MRRSGVRGTAAGLAAALALVLYVVGCARAPTVPARPAAVPRQEAPAAALALRFLGSTTLERAPEGVLRDFGGISGLDRDAVTGVWYLLSDDRSARAPVRFYTASIGIDASGVSDIRVTGVQPLRRPDGSLFAAHHEDGDAPDPEALRIVPGTRELVWSSEGDRSLGLQPFVRRASRNGHFVAELALPDNLRVHPDAEVGARDNLAIEGLAFAPDASLWVAMEAPLHEDGPVASLRQGGFTRFTRLDRGGRVLGQYAYALDAVPLPGSGGRRRSDNGVSEILSTDAGGLLVVERAGREVAEGVFRFAIRIYEARVDDATDVSATASLRDGGFRPMRKRLVLDLATAGIGDTDNIEAAAWGPRLPNGHATLLLVSDDNFHPRQASRFLAFEVLDQPPPAGPAVPRGTHGNAVAVRPSAAKPNAARRPAP